MAKAKSVTIAFRCTECNSVLKTSTRGPKTDFTKKVLMRYCPTERKRQPVKVKDVKKPAKK